MTESERKKDQHTQQISESVDRIKEKYPEFEARKDRFRFVCSDMLARLQNSTGQDFELFSVRIEEAGRLALSFGFQNPPIRSLFYERDGVSTISPPGPTNTPTQPLYWNNLRLNHPEVMFATGYRIYDPCIIPGNDFMASTFENGHFPVNDEWIDHVRSKLVKALGNWIREIDGMQEPITEPAIIIDSKTPSEKKWEGTVEENVLKYVAQYEGDGGNLIKLKQKDIANAIECVPSAVSGTRIWKAIAELKDNDNLSANDTAEFIKKLRNGDYRSVDALGRQFELRESRDKDSVFNEVAERNPDL